MTQRIVSAIVVLWLLAALGLSLAGAAQAAPMPAMGLIVGGPVLLALLGLAAVPPFRAWALGLDVRALTVFHAWRIVPGVAFLVLYDAGKLPWRFAGPAGWGDIAVAVTAPLAAYALGAATPARRWTLALWHVLGFADLVQVVASRVMLGLQGDALITAMAGFPLALLPLFAVPLTLILHVLPVILLARGPR